MESHQPIIPSPHFGFKATSSALLLSSKEKWGGEIERKIFPTSRLKKKTYRLRLERRLSRDKLLF